MRAGSRLLVMTRGSAAEAFTVHMFEELIPRLGRVDLHSVGVERSDMGRGSGRAGCREGDRGGGLSLLPGFLRTPLPDADIDVDGYTTG